MPVWPLPYAGASKPNAYSIQHRLAQNNMACEVTFAGTR